MSGVELDLFGDPVMRRDAFFRTPRQRIRLSRDWAPGPRAFVLGHNPSLADGLKEDPTSRWWNDWFRLFGFGGYDAGNLYPRCTADPSECRAWADWESNGPDWYARDAIHANLGDIVRMAKRAAQVFVCFGAIAQDWDWVEHVVEAIQSGEEPWPDLWCWGVTKGGAPKHPMARGIHRIPRDQRPILWRSADG